MDLRLEFTCVVIKIIFWEFNSYVEVEPRINIQLEVRNLEKLMGRIMFKGIVRVLE